MKNYVKINGVSSTTITGLAINELPPITKPLLRTLKEEIDGRDGDIITPLGYSAYDKTITISLFGGYNVNDVISFFTKEGTIIFSNEDDKVYYFKMIEQFDIQEILRFGSGTITFHCQPFKYPLTETPKIVEYEYITESDVESASLSNTTQAPLKIDLKGNTSQEDGVSPDTPKPIHSVSGDNTITIANMNLINLDNFTPATAGSTITKIDTGINIKNTSGGYAGRIDLSNLPTNTDYYLQYNYTNISSGMNRVGVFAGNTQTTQIKLVNDSNGFTFNTGNNTSINIWFYASAGTSAEVKYTNIQLKLGSTSTPYTPYQSQTYPINLPVENLIAHDLATIKTLNTGGTWSDNVYTQNSLNFTINNDGSVRVNGTASANTYLTYPTFTLKAGTYTLGAGIYINTLTRIQLVEDISGRPIIASTENGASSTFTTSADKSVFLQWRINSGEVIDKVFYPMLEKGSKANSYTPYGTTPIELCKIGTYQDYFYKDSGKWYLHKEIGKVVLNGSESWNIDNSGTASWSYRLSSSYIPKSNITSSTAYCSHYPITEIGNNDTTQGIHLITNGRLRIRWGTQDTTANFETWLSSNNVILDYILSTPTNTEITDTTLISQLEAIKSAYSYDTQTNISQVNNDKPFLLDIQALKDGTDTVVINNTGNVYSKPLIALEGTGQVEIYLNGVQIFQVDMTSNNKINIDIEKQEAYNPDDNALMNRKVIGDYSKFLLQSGNNTIKFTGALTKATITRYTRWY